MKRIIVGTKNLEKLLIINGKELKLDDGFLSSEISNLPGHESAFEFKYAERSRDEGEKLMEIETERICEFLGNIRYEDRINVYGNAVPHEPRKTHTPYVILVGKIKC